MSVPVTAEEKTKKKNYVKARSLLLMALSNDLNFTFHQYNEAKTIFATIETYLEALEELYSRLEILAPSTSSTNDVNTTKPAYEVSSVSPNVNTTSPQVSTASFSDNAVYAFMVENPNGSNLLYQDLEQIHEDDLKAIGFEVQLSTA
ncbi:hypothetical protein Tco_0586079 [Tanacetum coccineum]